MAGRPTKKGKAGKSRPSGPARCAVLWALDSSGERGAAVRGVLKEMGVLARTATYERLGDPAGALADEPGLRRSPVPYRGPAPEGEFVLLCNLSPDDVDRFLALSRERGCSVDAKAMLTRTNRTWPLVRLVAEVQAEHRAMAGADE